MTIPGEINQWGWVWGRVSCPCLQNVQNLPMRKIGHPWERRNCGCAWACAKFTPGCEERSSTHLANSSLKTLISYTNYTHNGHTTPYTARPHRREWLEGEEGGRREENVGLFWSWNGFLVGPMVKYFGTAPVRSRKKQRNRFDRVDISSELTMFYHIYALFTHKNRKKRY